MLQIVEKYIIILIYVTSGKCVVADNVIGWV